MVNDSVDVDNNDVVIIVVDKVTSVVYVDIDDATVEYIVNGVAVSVVVDSVAVEVMMAVLETVDVVIVVVVDVDVEVEVVVVGLVLISTNALSKVFIVTLNSLVTFKTSVLMLKNPSWLKVLVT